MLRRVYSPRLFKWSLAALIAISPCLASRSAHAADDSEPLAADDEDALPSKDKAKDDSHAEHAKDHKKAPKKAQASTATKTKKKVATKKDHDKSAKKTKKPVKVAAKPKKKSSSKASSSSESSDKHIAAADTKKDKGTVALSKPVPKKKKKH